LTKKERQVVEVKFAERLTSNGCGKGLGTVGGGEDGGTVGRAVTVATAGADVVAVEEA